MCEELTAEPQPPHPSPASKYRLKSEVSGVQGCACLCECVQEMRPSP